MNVRMPELYTERFAAPVPPSRQKRLVLTFQKNATRYGNQATQIQPKGQETLP